MDKRTRGGRTTETSGPGVTCREKRTQESETCQGWEGVTKRVPEEGEESVEDRSRDKRDRKDGRAR